MKRIGINQDFLFGSFNLNGAFGIFQLDIFDDIFENRKHGNFFFIENQRRIIGFGAVQNRFNMRIEFVALADDNLCILLKFLIFFDGLLLFEIIGSNRGVDQDPNRVYGRGSLVNGKETFKRLFIRNKKIGKSCKSRSKK